MRNWNGVKVAITGGGGFIGSHLVETLVKRGARVKALLKYSGRPSFENLKYLSDEDRSQIEVVFGDVRDAESMRSVIKDVEVVFHLAAMISIPYSIENPDEAFAVNCVGTMNLLEAVRAAESKPDRVVVTSTSEVYGTALYEPMKEDHPKMPRSPYAATKLAADSLAESYHRTYNLPITVARPFNTYGPRQSDRAVIPATIAQALWKPKITLGSLTPRRDFTFVTDTVRGFLACAENDTAVGETIHFGTGSAQPVSSIVQTVLSLLGIQKSVETDQRRVRPHASEVMALVANSSKARQALGWRPEVAWREGLNQTIQWVSNHRADYAPNEYRI